MRARLTSVLIAAVVVAGCGGAPVPDDATSRAQITRAVLAWHRYQADANGKAGCALLTKRARYAQGGADCAARSTATRRSPPRSARRCATPRWTQVTITGDKATVVTHTTATEGGVTRKTPPATIPLRWERGRWRVD